MDFAGELGEEPRSFDLLISLYAGFVSKNCKKYLKEGGILIANNSHGDAPLAYLDKSFRFVGVLDRNGDKFTYSNNALKSYFVPKASRRIEKKEIQKTMKGPAFQKTAYAYVFQKTSKDKFDAL